MPHGSRIALLMALLATGCHTGEKRGQQLLPLKPVVGPSSEATRPKGEPTAKVNPTGRAEIGSPIVTNEKFQNPIAVSGTPQPNVTPPLNTPTLPTSGLRGSAMTEPTPPSAPGIGGTPLPPLAEKSDGDFKVPSLTGPN